MQQFWKANQQMTVGKWLNAIGRGITLQQETGTSFEERSFRIHEEIRHRSFDLIYYSSEWKL